MEIKEKNVYDKLYQLSTICLDDVHKNNIIEFIRLLEVQITLYDQHQIPSEVKQTWLIQVTITIASLVEALLSEALNHVIEIIHQINGNKDFKFEKITRYEDMIDTAIQIKLLNVQPNVLHQLRNLRNNIHIQRLRFPIHKDRRYHVDQMHQALDLVYLISENLAQNILTMKGY